MSKQKRCPYNSPVADLYNPDMVFGAVGIDGRQWEAGHEVDWHETESNTRIVRANCGVDPSEVGQPYDLS